ncbi:MAG: hypothetical protein R3279_01215 [Putridiphycobacter sp.]|nr:hypothetical protein [Putridiphycobacter sp.]
MMKGIFLAIMIGLGMQMGMGQMGDNGLEKDVTLGQVDTLYFPFQMMKNYT